MGGQAGTISVLFGLLNNDMKIFVNSIALNQLIAQIDLHRSVQGFMLCCTEYRPNYITAITVLKFTKYKSGKSKKLLDGGVKQVLYAVSPSGHH